MVASQAAGDLNTSRRYISLATGRQRDHCLFFQHHTSAHPNHKPTFNLVTVILLPFFIFLIVKQTATYHIIFPKVFQIYIYIYSILKYVNNVWNLWACHHHTQSHARPKLCLSLKYLHCNPCRTEDPPNRKKKKTIWIFRYQRSLQKWSFAVNKSNKNRHPPSSRKKKLQEQQFNPCHLKQHVFSTNCPGPLAPAACKFLALSVFHGVLRMLRGFKTFTTSLRQGRRC